MNSFTGVVHNWQFTTGWLFPRPPYSDVVRPATKYLSTIIPAEVHGRGMESENYTECKYMTDEDE